MPSEIRTVEVTGKDSSSRQSARVDAGQKLAREVHRLGLVDVGGYQWEIHEARPGRFYAVARVQARPR